MNNWFKKKFENTPLYYPLRNFFFNYSQKRYVKILEKKGRPDPTIDELNKFILENSSYTHIEIKNDIIRIVP